MTVNLLDRFTQQYSETLLRQSGSTLGETADSIIAGIDMGSKAVLAGIVGKSRTEGSVDEWIYGAIPADWSQISHAPADEIFIQPNLDHFTNAGSSILRNIFGDQQNAIIDYVSGHARLKSSSSSTLMKVVAALMLRTIASYREETSLGRMDARNMLNEQMPYLQSAMPVDLQTQLGLSNDFAFGPPGSNPMVITDSAHSPMHVSKALPWVILLIAALGLFYFVEKGCNGAPATDHPQKMEVDSMKMDSI